MLSVWAGLWKHQSFFPKGYWMHSVEFPATISCRSQATTTARCRLRGRMHLLGSPSPGLTLALLQPPAPGAGTRGGPTCPREATEPSRPW